MTRHVSIADAPLYLRYLRERAGITQLEMSEVINARRGVVTNIENGVYDMRLSRLQTLAKALGYTVSLRFTRDK